jgi:3-deoxy-D-manno-octulosonic-acid transferase
VAADAGGVRAAGIPVAVVNARVSDRSLCARGAGAGGLGAGAAAGGAVSGAERGGWAAAGGDGGAGGAVRAIGNLKYDVRAPKASRVAELIKEAAAGRPIVVAGSTVGARGTRQFDEEEMVFRHGGVRGRNWGAAGARSAAS